MHVSDNNLYGKPDRGRTVHLPQLEVRVFDNMGHGQLLHQHPEEYARLLVGFLGGQ